MSALEVVGRNPDSDSSITHKAYVDSVGDTLEVTTDFVNSVIALQAEYLVTPASVDAQDAVVAQKTDVDAADQYYVPLDQLGQPNGVATLDSNGSITSSQIPSDAMVNRTAIYYSAAGQGNIFLAPGTTHNSVTQQTREYQIANITVLDPGYEWYPLCFATVQGYAGGSDGGVLGNGNYGRLLVQPPQGVSDTIYAAGICASDVNANSYSLVPYAALNATPLTSPRVTGSLELGLYGSCWAGGSYFFSGTGLMFYIMVVPAM